MMKVTEVKSSIDVLLEVHLTQVTNYLIPAGKKLGLLINFKVVSLEDKKSLLRINNYK